MKAGIEVPAAGRRSQAAVRLGLRCGFAAIDSVVIHCLEVPSARIGVGTKVPVAGRSSQAAVRFGLRCR